MAEACPRAQLVTLGRPSSRPGPTRPRIPGTGRAPRHRRARPAAHGPSTGGRYRTMAVSLQPISSTPPPIQACKLASPFLGQGTAPQPPPPCPTRRLVPAATRRPLPRPPFARRPPQAWPEARLTDSTRAVRLLSVKPCSWRSSWGCSSSCSARTATWRGWRCSPPWRWSYSSSRPTSLRPSCPPSAGPSSPPRPPDRSQRATRQVVAHPRPRHRRQCFATRSPWWLPSSRRSFPGGRCSSTCRPPTWRMTPARLPLGPSAQRVTWLTPVEEQLHHCPWAVRSATSTSDVTTHAFPRPHISRNSDSRASAA
mmetsp:Transcript_28327/g.76308  ORF Transcript_28327/g.76308 Transcript_28327/m.76308 type:complete len:311 (-) Transcript_28327:299-1231(-)